MLLCLSSISLGSVPSRCIGEYGGKLHAFMTLASQLGHFALKGGDSDVHLLGGWVGPRANLDQVANRKTPASA